MLKQQLRMEIKEISAEGSFTGILSQYGVLDQGGDIVEAGAFKKSISERGDTVPLLWQHKQDMPIGKLTLRDGPEELNVEGQLLMELPEAQKAYLLIKHGIISGLSIGYETIKRSVKDGIRHLTELKLFEGSIVTIPMLDTARITNIKRRETKDDFNEELSDIQLQDAGYQMMCALRCALAQLPGSGMTRDEILSAADTILQQFSDAFRTYLPMYLDMIAEDGYYGMQTMGLEKIEVKAGPTKRVDGADLTSDCFAYVGDKNDVSTWKLPIKFPGDEEKTKAHIRNALARFSRTTGIPDSEKPRVLAKIQAAAKRYGIDVAKGAMPLEEKVGRMISAANMEKLSTARDHASAVHEILSALTDSTDTTPEGAGAVYKSQAAGSKSEPEKDDHSAIKNLVKGFFD